MRAGGCPPRLACLGCYFLRLAVGIRELYVVIGQEHRDAPRMFMHHGLLARRVMDAQDADLIVLELDLVMFCVHLHGVLRTRDHGRRHEGNGNCYVCELPHDSLLLLGCWFHGLNVPLSLWPKNTCGLRKASCSI